MADDAEFLHVRRDAAVATVTLNRPQKLNSLNLALQQELFGAMSALEYDPDCRVIVLTGTGRAFCSGQDLDERRRQLAEGTPDLGASLERYYNPLVRLIRNGKTPVVASLNGLAAGAGANLALVCDIVVAARSARLMQPFARIGLVPDCGGTWMLPRPIGDGRARALMLLAEELSADTAMQCGLVWKAVPDDELASATAAIARRLADASALAVQLMKQALAASWSNSLDSQLALEGELQGQAGRGDDYRKAVAGFFSDRAHGTDAPQR